MCSSERRHRHVDRDSPVVGGSILSPGRAGLALREKPHGGRRIEVARRYTKLDARVQGPSVSLVAVPPRTTPSRRDATLESLEMGW